MNVPSIYDHWWCHDVSHDECTCLQEPPWPSSPGSGGHHPLTGRGKRPGADTGPSWLGYPSDDGGRNHASFYTELERHSCIHCLHDSAYCDALSAVSWQTSLTKQPFNNIFQSKSLLFSKRLIISFVKVNDSWNGVLYTVLVNKDFRKVSNSF